MTTEHHHHLHHLHHLNQHCHSRRHQWVSGWWLVTTTTTTIIYHHHLMHRAINWLIKSYYLLNAIR